MEKSVQEESQEIAKMGKKTATRYARMPVAKKALKSLGLTQKEFVSHAYKYADEVAQAVFDITQGKLEVEDTRSEGRKARDWYAKKQGMTKQEKDMFLPNSKDIEKYAKENDCSVFQAVARMSAI